MAYLFGSARIDENGKISGGKAGDQTGKEVSTQAPYNSSKGWLCFEWKDAKMAAICADQMKQACDNKHIGYDQNQRSSLFNYVNSNTIKNLKDVTKDVETDCSALVRVCILLASGRDVGNIRTISMPSILSGCGLFETKKSWKVGNPCKVGAILVTETSGHTVVMVEGDSYEVKFKPYKVEIANCSALNVRAGAGTSFKALGTVKKGHKMTIREENDGWGRVICYLDNAPLRIVKGWISLKYTKKI